MLLRSAELAPADGEAESDDGSLSDRIVSLRPDPAAALLWCGPRSGEKGTKEIAIPLEPREVESALIEALRQDVHVSHDAHGLRVDTPYILEDGALLRVHIQPVPGNGHAIVSDGGYAREQVEIFSRSESLLRSHYKEMEQIATRLGLKWDTEFSYTESDLDALVRRIPVLAEAASRALSLTRHRPRRRHGPLRDELRAELRDLGLGVKSRAKIALTKDLPTVTVDFEVRNGSAAAVEVLSSRTAAGSLIAVDRAVANFHVLDRGGYAGRLFAVYDEASPAGEPTARNRFIAAAPETAVLVAGAEAAPTIERELKAAH